MELPDILKFLRSHRLAVEASISSGASPQAALVGYGITDDLEIVFDTLDSSRKAQNLRSHPAIALVIGGWLAGDERTVQYEGVAMEASGELLERARPHYWAAWPEVASHAAWPGLTWFVISPRWLRYSDFQQSPALIVELRQGEAGFARSKEVLRAAVMVRRDSR
jgi:hypothetical protein